MWPRVHPPDLNLASAGGLGDVLRQGAEMRAGAARPRGHVRFPWKLMRNCPPLSHKERVLACGACERIVPPELRQPARGAFSIGGLEEKALRRRIGLLGLGACGEQHRRHEPSDHRDSCGAHLMLSSFQLNLCEEILTRLFAPGVRSAQRPRSPPASEQQNHGLEEVTGKNCSQNGRGTLTGAPCVTNASKQDGPK